VARLAPGVDLQQARGDADRIAGQLTASHPDVYGAGGYGIGVRPLRETLVGDAAPSFILLLALTFLVVLIASANVANLNLAQLAGRRQELSVREAVGADPGRIRRQLFTESLLTALTGALLGLGFAWLVLDLLRDFAARYTPLAGEIQLDGFVLLFTLAIACLSGLFSGMAVAHGRTDLGSALKAGGDKTTSSAGANQRRQLLLV